MPEKFLVDRLTIAILLAAALAVTFAPPAEAQVAPPSFSKAFSPNAIFVDDTSTLTFTIDNSASGVAADSLAFTDNLPAGVVVETPAGAITTCTSGTLTAISGGGTISYSGGSVVAGATCTVMVDVTSAVSGTMVNTSGDLTSNAGNSGTASDTLFVENPGTIIIDKVTSPPGDPTSFDFTLMDAPQKRTAPEKLLQMFSLTDADAPYDSGPISPGVYAVTETPPPGWFLTDAVCDNEDSPDNIFVNSGQTVTCTFTNTKLSDVGFSKSFLPDTIGKGSVAMLTFTIDNSNGVQPVNMLAFTDTLPTEITLAAPAFVSNTCFGTVTAPDGGGTITLVDGMVGAFQTCTIVVNVTASVPGDGPYINVSGDLTSSDGNSGSATDELMVDDNLASFTKSFAPSTVEFGDRSTLTFTIDNTTQCGECAPDISALIFTDNLPPGMVVADPANASTDCGSTAVPAVLTAAPGSSVISLSAIGNFSFPVLDGEDTCTVTVDVIGGAVGRLGNVSGELLATINNEQISVGKAAAVLEVTGFDTLLELGKRFIDDPVAPGGTVTLEFTVTNKSRDDSATGITFSDDLEATLSGLTPTLPPTPDPPCGAGSNLVFGMGVLTLTGGTLPPASSCTFSIELNIPAGAIPGAYPNTAGPVSGDVGGSPETGNSAGDLLFVVSFPVLTKEFTDDPVGAGGTVTLEFTITNPESTSTMSGVTFVDVFNEILPTSPTGAPAPSFCNGTGVATYTPLFDSPGIDAIPAKLLIENVSLAANGMPGDSCTFSITLDVVAAAAAGIYPNTTGEIRGVLDGFPGPPTVVGPPASDDLVVIGGPRLIKEFIDDPVPPGGTVTLEFTLSHDEFAPGDATGISFTDDLAALVPVISGLTANLPPTPDPPCGPGSSLTGSAGDTFLTFAGGTLAPGEECTFSVSLNVPVGAVSGFHANTTSDVTATVSDLTATGIPATDELLVSGLLFTKEFADDPVIAGGTVTLAFILDNTTGTADATGISFSDNLSAALPGFTASLPPTPDPPCGAGSVLGFGSGVLTLIGGSVTAGTSCTFSVPVTVPVATPDDTYLNVTGPLAAMIGGGGVSLPPANDNLEVNSTLLEITKEFTDDPVAPGGTVTLEFTVTNLSASETVTDIAFDDNLDAALTGLEATTVTVNTCGGMATSGFPTGLFEYAGGSLMPGASCTITLLVGVPPAPLPGNVFPNTTTGVTGNVGALDVFGEPASDDLKVLLLTFNKSFDGPAVAAGTAVLSFTIENLDASNGVNDLAFSDDLNAVISGLVAIGLPANDVCGAGSVLAGSSFLTLSGGNLMAGGSCTFDVDLQVPPVAAPGTHLNTTSDLLQAGLPVGSLATAELEIDSVLGPPTVIAVDSDLGTGDGMLDECESALVKISRLFVAFSEPVYDPAGDTDPDDVTNPANYLVVAAGPDADFDTAACGTVFPDDISVPIAGVSYDDGSATATLSLSNPLPSLQIRLLVCGSTSIYDLVGNPLDGSGDGIGGDDFVLTFRSDPFNALNNGHFDCDTNGWVLTSATPGEILHSPVDVDNSDVSGSLEFMQLGSNTAYEATQCAGFNSDAATQLTAVSQLTVGAGVQLSLTAGCTSFASADCSGPSLGASSITAILGDSGGTWQPIELTVTERPRRQSILCNIKLSVPNGNNFSLRLDSTVLEVDSAIFADGFESGDTSAWSTTVGGTP